MMEKILLGSSYLAQAIVMATIAFAVISTIYYLRYNKKIICQPGWIIKYIFLVYIATVGMITRVLDITSWSYGGFTAWNIVPFVNESWKLMLLNTLMFLPMGLFVPTFIKKIKWNYGKAILAGALVLVMINGFLSIPFYEKTVSIGDMILDSLNLNSWSGNSGYILSYNGIHYTMIPCIILAVISWAIAHRHPKDYGAKTAKIISTFMIVCFVGNLIQILNQDSIIPMLAASIVCAVISRKTIRY